MVRKLTKEESKFYRKYHIPGCGNLTSVKVNALFIRKGNTYEHEAAKFRVCWNLLKEGKTFLTEAARSKKRGDKSEKVVDVVDLTGETEIEVVHRNESHADVKAYRCEMLFLL